MTKETEQIVARYNAAPDEVKSAIMRGLRIYCDGTEAQKRILDTVAHQKMKWPEILETLAKAEATT